MKLISETEYDRLTKSKPSLPLPRDESAFHEKSVKASEVLSQQSIPDDIKLALYNNLIHSLFKEFSALKEKDTPKSNPKEDGNNQLKISDAVEKHDKIMLSAFPTKTRKSAEILVSLMKKHPGTVSWDHSGNMIFYGEPNSRGANIHDLLSYVLRPTMRFARPPPGLNTFLHIMECLNMPRSLFGVVLRNTQDKSNAELLRSRVTLGPQDIPDPPARKSIRLHRDRPWLPPIQVNSDTPIEWEEFGSYE